MDGDDCIVIPDVPDLPGLPVLPDLAADAFADAADARDDTDDDGRASTEGEYAPDGTRRPVGVLRASPRLRRESPKRRLRRLRREEAAAEALAPLPGDGEEVSLILSGHFHGFDLIAAMLEIAEVPARRLRLATLAINKAHSRALARLMDDGRFERLDLIVGDVFREHTPGEWEELVRLFGRRPGARVVSDRNHAKLALLELADGRKLTMHGSLNLRRCSAYEQAVIVGGTELHDFYAGFVDAVVAQKIGGGEL